MTLSFDTTSFESGADRAVIAPSRGLIGVVDLPPDKSIAHRAAILSAIADGTSRIVNYPDSKDPQSTLRCLRAVGIQMREEDDILVIDGRGLLGLTASTRPIDCGNSGTTMRLLAGILAGQSFESVLTGDESLSARPMDRIAHPLARMGGSVQLVNGHAPIRISGSRSLQGIRYRLPVASAQVKSSVLLAGLFASGETQIIETTPTRDHTERMLGLDVVEVANERIVSVKGGTTIAPRLWSIPRDFSAAAFFLVAGSILPSSSIRMPRVGLNPSRAGLIDILRAMGGDIRIENERIVGGEPIGDVTVGSAELTGIELGGNVIAGIIDEIPVLAVAAACADGVTVIRNADELRNKETDRIKAMVSGLSAMGVTVRAFEDGMEIRGGTIRGGTVDSFGDHRVAMALAVAGLVGKNATTVRGADSASVSFPGFWNSLNELGA